MVRPPVPAPEIHDGDVDVEGEDATELIDAPGWVPSPAIVDPLVSTDTQLEPPAPP